MPHAAQVKRLSQVAAALADAVTPEEVGAVIVGRGVIGTDAYAGAVLLLSDDATRLELLSACGFAEAQLTAYATVPLDLPVPVATVARTGEPVFLPTPAARSEAFPAIEPLPSSRAWAALPLRARGRLLGTLALSFEQPQGFDELERTFLQGVAQQCALALDRALLLADRESAAAELRATVAALHGRELQLRMAQHAASAGSWEVDPASDLVWISPELDALLELGTGGGPMPFSTWTERVHPDDRAVVLTAVDGVRRQPAIDIEFRYDHPRLGVRRLNAIGRRVAEGDAPSRLHGITVDITARRAAEEELRRQQAQMRMVVDAAGLGTWQWDVRADRGTWDGTTCRIFGVPQGTPGHRDFFLSRVHPDDRDRIARAVETALERHETYQDEYRIVLPDGEVRWLADHARVTRDPAGAPVRMAGVTLDVTDRRRADEQLRQMQRIESIGRLAGGMAHEINNMMSVVLGFAEFVLRSPALPGEARADLLEIQKAAERAAGVTRQVLAFSRQQVLVPETLDINAVVSDAHAMLDRLLGDSFEVALELDPGAGVVRADRNQVIQALVNLALNARDAMPDGGRVSIATSHRRLGAGDLVAHIGTEAVPGFYAGMSVADTGAGMTPDVLARAFEPFFTTKPVGGGTGLGLSTVYGIVKQSGGYVWAESVQGQGTTVTVLLPVAAADATGEAACDPSPTAIEGSGTVLIVEDEPLVLLMARRTLEELGYTVAAAADGRSALELVSALGEELQLVVTDVMMPGMNGRELGARIAHVRPDLPVLFVSGHPSQFVVENGLLEPGQAFLQKPFLPDVLGAAVRALLDAARR